MEKPKILAVDDKPANLFALAKILDKIDVELFKAQSGKEALELTLDHDFALVLLDVQMPDMDGYEVTELLRSEESTKRIPIIFITAIDRDEKFEIKGYETGAVDFIFKPFDERILLSKVKVFVELYKAEMELVMANVQLEASAERANLMAQEAINAAQAKAEFLANMSHEIRTPMNAIMGFADIMAEEELTEQQSEYLKIIRNSGKNLLGIIDDILNLAKIQAGKLKTEIISCSLDELLESIHILMKPVAAQKNLKFDISRCDNLPEKINTDPTRLRQCMINLIGNAIKFTEQGHVMINVCMLQENDKSFIRFDVEDTGIGIPPEKHQGIFDSFTQVDGGTTRKYGGTGLGLAITKHLVQLLNGKISLSSEHGKGSVFSIIIPADTKPNQTEVAVSQDSTTEESNILEQRFSGHALIVEDAVTNQKLAKLMLEKLGLETALAGDGQEAIKIVNEQSFDIIFMDMQMPIMNGYDATKTLRAQGIEVPIIALTACAMKGDEKKCLQVGCDGYLSKPIRTPQLIQILGEYLCEKQTAESAADSL
jgi:signal transduction histidine kinase